MTKKTLTARAVRAGGTALGGFIPPPHTHPRGRDVRRALVLAGALLAGCPVEDGGPASVLYRGGSAVGISGREGATVIDKAVSWLRDNAEFNTTYTLVLGENIPAQGTVTLDDEAFNGNIYVTLVITTADAAERTVTIDAAGGSLFTLSGDIPKTLVLDGAVKLAGKADNTAALVVIRGGNSTLELRGGALITGNTCFYIGGGVYIYDAGTFIMNGGAVSGNAAVHGGGVVIETAGTFVMESGAVSGNTAGGQGGGLLIGGGVFTMNGGSISGNTAQHGGGGVQAQGAAAVTINGGTVSDNLADGEYDDGGGGFLVYESAALTVTGGEIKGNSSASRGGGISVCDDATLVLSGGTISHNTAAAGLGRSLYLYAASGTAQYGNGANIPLDEDGGRGTSKTLTGRM